MASLALTAIQMGAFRIYGTAVIVGEICFLSTGR